MLSFLYQLSYNTPGGVGKLSYRANARYLICQHGLVCYGPIISKNKYSVHKCTMHSILTEPFANK